MRFLSIIRINENTGQVPSEKLMSDMGKLIEQWSKAGVLVDTGGLRPTKEGVRIRNHHGKFSVTDGPFTETKEVLGGYAILKVASKAEAVEHTQRFLEIHGRDWDITCELRQIEEPDFAG